MKSIFSLLASFLVFGLLFSPSTIFSQSPGGTGGPLGGPTGPTDGIVEFPKSTIFKICGNIGAQVNLNYGNCSQDSDFIIKYNSSCKTGSVDIPIHVTNLELNGTTAQSGKITDWPNGEAFYLGINEPGFQTTYLGPIEIFKFMGIVEDSDFHIYRALSNYTIKTDLSCFNNSNSDDDRDGDGDSGESFDSGLVTYVNLSINILKKTGVDTYKPYEYLNYASSGEYLDCGLFFQDPNCGKADISDYKFSSCADCGLCSGKPQIQHLDKRLIKEEESLTQQMFVNPNPFSENLTISYTTLEETDLNIFVFNAIGETVLQQNASQSAGSHSYILDTSEFNSGVFFVTIIDNDGKRYTEKIMKVD